VISEVSNYYLKREKIPILKKRQDQTTRTLSGEGKCIPWRED